MSYSLLNIPGLPQWMDITLVAVDAVIRIIALCWIPYNR